MTDVVAWWFGLSVVAAAIAGARGRSAIGYLFLSLFLSPLIGIPCALFAGRRAEVSEDRQVAAGHLRRCPQCAEAVRVEARVCKHCHAPLSAPAPRASTASAYSFGRSLGRAMRR